MGAALILGAVVSGLLGWFSIRDPEGVRAIYLSVLLLPRGFTEPLVPGPWFFKLAGYTYLFAVSPILLGLGIQAIWWS